jgi:Fic family protein
MPEPLPPSPPLRMRTALIEGLSAADLALGRLDGAALTLPNVDLFVGMYVRQEAVLSSRIEGTQASLTDVLQYQVEDGVERPRDVREVVNCVDAMNHGLARLVDLPLSLRLVREIHARLLDGVRGSAREPGEFRRSQNWIGAPGATPGTAAFVPPPAHEIVNAMGALEKFWHERAFPPLIRAGLSHAQFETIHPFLDGNGRLGRLLITFMLCQEGVLRRPLLYLSAFLKEHRAEYYDRLQAVREEGRWEEWLAFFLRGVREVATSATETVWAIVRMQQAHVETIRRDHRTPANLLRLVDLLFQQPVVTVRYVEEHLGVAYVTANTLVRRLVDQGILTEGTGHRRNRRFVYQAYLRLFEPSGPSG